MYATKRKYYIAKDMESEGVKVIYDSTLDTHSKEKDSDSIWIVVAREDWDYWYEHNKVPTLWKGIPVKLKTVSVNSNTAFIELIKEVENE